MIALSLGVLIVGLVLGVFAMLYGTERTVRAAPSARPSAMPHERTSEHDQAAEPSPFFNRSSLAAFSVGFGLTGYALATYTAWPVGVQIVLAILVGVLALWIQALLITRWAIPGARAEHVEERYFLQGTLAHIVRDVPVGDSGALRYTLDGRDYELPARDIDGNAIPAGTDVVIDRVDDGIAYVELWVRVEQRL